jgi:hypothetical protein
MSNQDEDNVERKINDSFEMLKAYLSKKQEIPEEMMAQLEAMKAQMLDPQARQQMMSRHSAGATISPVHPFQDLGVLRNDEELSSAFVKKWVIPFYMQLPSYARQIRDELLAIKPEIDHQTIAKLLGDFNWRTRTVGAYFAALGKQYDFFPTIGNMLLQSEVCYAGRTYAIALATYRPEVAVSFYEKYLKYYLTQPQYDLQQYDVHAALLSQAKTVALPTKMLAEIEELWIRYVEWNKERYLPATKSTAQSEVQEIATSGLQSWFERLTDVGKAIEEFDQEVQTLIEVRDA